MTHEGWWEWAAVRGGDRVWMGGRPEHGGGWYAVDQDPIPAPAGWGGTKGVAVWVVVAGVGKLLEGSVKVWCAPATYRPQDEGDDTFRKAQALVAERLGGVQVGGFSERRG